MKRWQMAVLVLAVLGVGVLLLIVGPGDTSARTISVDNERKADFSKVQDALDAAGDGDEIRVYGGVYKENLVIERAVNLTGTGPNATVICGKGCGGVVKVYSDWVNLSGLTITGNGNENRNIGIHLMGSHTTITNTRVLGTRYGIVFSYRCTYTTITNNTFCNVTWGITMGHDGHTIIANNTFISNRAGSIYLGCSSSMTIRGNVMTGRGIDISPYYPEWTFLEMDESNTVNGKPVRFYKNASDITVPPDAGQVFLANCSRVVVEGQDLRGVTVGVFVISSSNITIAGNDCRDMGRCGIYLLWTENTTITGNKCSGDGSGIWLRNSHHNRIEDNLCSWNDDTGIDLYHGGSDNTLVNNTCSFNGGSGICLGGIGSSILDNICLDNEGQGIYTEGKNITLSGNTCTGNANGIVMDRISWSNISQNHCVANERNGLHIRDRAHNNSFTENVCYANECGFYLLWYTQNNIITNNSLEHNDCGIRMVYPDEDFEGPHPNLIENNSFSGNGVDVEKVYRPHCEHVRFGMTELAICSLGLGLLFVLLTIAQFKSNNWRENLRSLLRNRYLSSGPFSKKTRAGSHEAPLKKQKNRI